MPAAYGFDNRNRLYMLPIGTKISENMYFSCNTYKYRWFNKHTYYAQEQSVRFMLYLVISILLYFNEHMFSYAHDE